MGVVFGVTQSRTRLKRLTSYLYLMGSFMLLQACGLAVYSSQNQKGLFVLMCFTWAWTHSRGLSGDESCIENRDLPGGSVAKTPCSQCKGRGFDPWLGN